MADNYIFNNISYSENIRIFLSIVKLHSVVCYSPVNVHRIADKLNNALSAILWTLIGL